MIARLFQAAVLLGALLTVPKALAEMACIAQWNVLGVSMVPNNPLLAEAWVSFWDVRPDGTAVLKRRDTLLRIARDSSGRVSIRFGTVQPATSSSQNNIEPIHWMTTLCDPQEKSYYLFSSNGDSEVIKSKGGGIPGSLRVTGFSSPPSVPRGGRQIPLDPRTLVGYPASGYRTWSPQNSAVDSSLYLEQWFSESLALELSHWNVKSGIRAEVTRIDRQEPDTSLMAVPSGRKIVEPRKIIEP